MNWTDIHLQNDMQDLYEYATTHRHGHFRVHFRGLLIHCIDLLSLYMAGKDIFLHRIYDFTTHNPNPCIIDGGAHIGLFSLRAAQMHPTATILAFEPDEEALALLRLNIQANSIKNVTIIPAGLHNIDGTLSFSSRGDDGNTLYGNDANTTVQVTRLSRHLKHPVDFLKLNIEGSEWPVLEECGCLLRNIHQLVLEYHAFPELGDRLHCILQILHEQGFRYMIHDFDAQTNAATKPPFLLEADTRYFLLVAAKNMGITH
ncbi:MAG: FkbM family methyltransferase [Desulfovibrionaceae bacterium]